MGRHFTSPRKARDKKKSRTTVSVPGHASKRQKLLDELGDLLTAQPSGLKPSLNSGVEAASPIHRPEELPEALQMEPEDMLFTFDDEDKSCDATEERVRTACPTTRSISMCAGWKSLIPTIVDPFLKYSAAALGQPLVALGSRISSCTSNCQEQKLTTVLCLFFDRKELQPLAVPPPNNKSPGFASIDVHSCCCSSLPQTLVLHGLFPTAPAQPRMAVSVELLSFYRALFERSCDAVNALAAALSTYYTRRGFCVTNHKVSDTTPIFALITNCQPYEGKTVADPFRRGLSQAAQWYNILEVELEKRVDSAIQQSRLFIKPANDSFVDPLPSTPSTAVQQESSSRSSCAEILIQRCPACFGGTSFGSPLDNGSDIHVATDGNFHHRHWRSAGDCLSFYEPSYFIPKGQVDAVGRNIDHARCHPSKLSQTGVPDEAIDQCEASYEAADGQKPKAAMENFDHTGLMALICRHDIPLFFANIDTLGEQQKYSVALIRHLFSLLPSQATVVVLYDVGCVLARSLSRVSFSTCPSLF